MKKGRSNLPFQFNYFPSQSLLSSTKTHIRYEFSSLMEIDNEN
nr:MAG TPA: hypothetical protein [Bacteriophage sp.]